jgi:hypothetical protein
MGSHDSFGHSVHKLWPKERPEVKLAVWLPTTKSWESTQFLACRWHATYHWKALDEGYNFALNLILIGGLHTKLWCPKVAKVLILGISGLQFGSPGTKCHLDVGLVERHKIYYKGEGVASPESRPWWILWVRVRPWLVLAPKVLKLCINQLVVWFVQVRVSNWCLSFFLVPIPELQHAPLPQSVASQGVCPNSLLFHCFHLKLTFESIKEVGNTSKIVIFQKLWATCGDIILLIPFVCAFYAFEFPLFYSHHNCEVEVMVIPSAMGTH